VKLKNLSIKPRCCLDCGVASEPSSSRTAKYGTWPEDNETENSKEKERMGVEIGIINVKKKVKV
jgi:hypothetical protein